MNRDHLYIGNPPLLADETKERPIIFSGPMVRAILEGRKTQTRRIVKNDRQNIGGGDGINCRVAKLRASTRRTICPYGQPGDRLWVRETWAESDMADGSPVIYLAGGCVSIGLTAPDNRDFLIPWRSPIHMPRWASRILLEVVSVRVERLRDISEADAMAEGGKTRRISTGDIRTGLRDCVSIGCSEAESAKQAYELLWESIHGDGSWDANPLVWVVEFKVKKCGE